MFYTYLLRCADGSLYAGITTDPARRFSQHAGARPGGAKYTASHRPVRMEAVWRAADRAAASRLEYRLKRMSHAKKELLLTAPDTPPFPAGYRRVPITPDGRMIPMLFLCYPKCSTCRKGADFLDRCGVAHETRDIAAQNPTERELRAWHEKSGLPLKRFFNTSGQAYRRLGLSQRLPELSEDEQYRLLASDGMLVRRPLLIGEHFVLIGFRQKEWEEALAPGAAEAHIKI